MGSWTPSIFPIISSGSTVGMGASKQERRWPTWKRTYNQALIILFSFVEWRLAPKHSQDVSFSCLLPPQVSSVKASVVNEYWSRCTRMKSTGVIPFILIGGFPPWWDIPCQTLLFSMLPVVFLLYWASLGILYHSQRCGCISLAVFAAALAYSSHPSYSQSLALTIPSRTNFISHDTYRC